MADSLLLVVVIPRVLSCNANDGAMLMSDFFHLSDAQMQRIGPFLPKSRGQKQVDDTKVISGIIFIIRNGLRWRDAPKSA